MQVIIIKKNSIGVLQSTLKFCWPIGPAKDIRQSMVTQDLFWPIATIKLNILHSNTTRHISKGL